MKRTARSSSDLDGGVDGDAERALNSSGNSDSDETDEEHVPSWSHQDGLFQADRATDGPAPAPAPVAENVHRGVAHLMGDNRLNMLRARGFSPAAINQMSDDDVLGDGLAIKRAIANSLGI